MKNQEKKNSSNKIIITLLIIITCISIGVAVWAVTQKNASDNINETTVSTEPVSQNPDSIAIPGYEAITLKANSKKQSVALSNPPQNMCYFKITLKLKDGTVLWVSDYVKPGKNSKPIILKRALEKGNYSDAVIKYECFSLNDKSVQLNSAETKLTLKVN